jgi:hypothetical protein
MKVNVDQVLKNMDGSSMKDVDVDGNAIDATLKMAIVNALLAPVERESGTDKMRKFNLAQKAYAGGDIEFDLDELKLIKDRVGDIFPPLVVGTVYQALGV